MLLFVILKILSISACLYLSLQSYLLLRGYILHITISKFISMIQSLARDYEDLYVQIFRFPSFSILISINLKYPIKEFEHGITESMHYCWFIVLVHFLRRSLPYAFLFLGRIFVWIRSTVPMATMIALIWLRFVRWLNLIENTY